MISQWIFLLSLFFFSKANLNNSFDLQMDHGILRSISPLSQEKTLNLSGLEIKVIKPNAFDKLRNISILDLSNNHINELPELTFSNFTNLQQLLLKNNKNSINLDRHFLNLTKLKLLDLSGKNSVFNLKAEAFVGLPDDAEIKVPDGFFSLSPKMFSVNESLQAGQQNLSLGNCTKTGPGPLLLNWTGRSMNPEYTRNLTTKICQSNGIVQEIGIDSANCESLRFTPRLMFLNGRSIKGFQKNWYRLSSDYKILELYIEKNEMTEIDENVLNDLPDTVSIVFLKRNKINILRNNVMNNSHIRQMELYRNNIQLIEDKAFAYLTSLLDLDLSFNNVSSLEFVSGLPESIVSLKLIGCNIRNIPDMIFTNLRNLATLDLSINAIESITEKTLNDLPQLSRLVLDQNAITRIEKGPYDLLPCLQVLSFSHNTIDFIEKGFARYLNNIDTLYIDFSVKVTKLEQGLLFGLPINATVFPAPRLESVQPGLFKNHS